MRRCERICQGPNKLTQCDSTLAGLPPADGMLLMDAHPSNASNALRAVNPAVFNEDCPDLVDPTLDPFNPANGYNPESQSHYPPEFVKRYSEAQAKRMNRWIDRALYIRKLMKDGSWIYPDNHAFVIPRGNDRATNIFAMDTSILCCTKRPQRLLKNDGTIVTQIINSVRPPAKSPDKEFIAIEGATHGYTPCRDCEGGPYNNSVKNLFDYLAKRINTRFR